jgi:hypothetical protein
LGSGSGENALATSPAERRGSAFFRSRVSSSRSLGVRPVPLTASAATRFRSAFVSVPACARASATTSASASNRTIGMH